MQPRAIKKGRIWLVSLAVALVVLAAGIRLGMWEPPGQVRTLPDGSSLTLDGVTFGKQSFVRGTLLQRLLLPVVPPSVRKWVGGQYFDSSFVRPTRGSRAILWFRQRTPVTVDLTFGATLVSIDERGRESGPAEQDAGWLQNVTYPGSVDLPHGEQLVPWPLLNFPRRGRTVRVRLFGREPFGKVGPRLAEFSFANPDPGLHPVWKPDPLPVTRRNGNVTVTLLNVITGAKHDTDSGYVKAAPGEEQWTYLLIKAERNGRAQPGYPKDVSYTDGTGNVVAPRGNFSAQGMLDNDVTRIGFPGGLWSDEAAYKVHMVVLDRPFDFILKPSTPAGK